MSRPIPLLACSLAFLTACEDMFELEGSGDDPCDVSVEMLDVGETSGLGLSAEEMIELVGGTFTDTFTYVAGTSTPLRFGARLGDGLATFVHSAPAPGAPHDTGTGEDLCRPSLTVGAVLALSTDDGAFAEELPGLVWAEDADTAHFAANLDPSALTGSFDVLSVLDGSDWATVTLDLEGGGDGWKTWGGVGGHATTTEVCDESGLCTASTSPFGVGDWQSAGW